MEQLVEEFGHPTYTSFPVIAARLLLATLFGAAIGFEREWRNRPAGLRTHILVCVAAATFAILTIEIVHRADVRLRDRAHRSDPRGRGGDGWRRLPGGRRDHLLARRGARADHRRRHVAGRARSASPAASASGRSRSFATLLALVVLGLLHAFEVKLGISEDKKAAQADRRGQDNSDQNGSDEAEPVNGLTASQLPRPSKA